MVARPLWSSRAIIPQHSTQGPLQMPRRFAMVRYSDPSGVSGVGLVAYGVQFDDGHVAVRWVSDAPSTSLWDGIADLMAVHGHRGATVVHWIDPEPGAAPAPRANGSAARRVDAEARRSAMSHRIAGRHRAD
jgi:hypothetical protein